ncbi:small nuclear ribonucleoprotein E [Vairimorpha necatrix]|uniref:Small nuclear ribonucleoprotein E n=1 Tax=Vairimorpha necatrix TaxID=6039 RepID=A0AAX4JBH0_9MICR
MEESEIRPLESIYLGMVDKKEVEVYEKEGNMIHRGKIVGFDEYMNLVIETGHSRYLLKGDCILSINIKK